jgi:hypothetical protein
MAGTVGKSVFSFSFGSYVGSEGFRCFAVCLPIMFPWDLNKDATIRELVWQVMVAGCISRLSLYLKTYFKTYLFLNGDDVCLSMCMAQAVY